MEQLELHKARVLTCTTRVFKAHHPTSNCRIRCNACPLYSKQRHIKGQRQVGPPTDLELPNTQVSHGSPRPQRKRNCPAQLCRFKDFARTERARVSQSQQIPDPFHARLKRSISHRPLVDQRADLKATEDPRHESTKTASEAPRPWKFLKDTDARNEKSVTDKDANRDMPSKVSDDPQVAK